MRRWIGAGVLVGVSVWLATPWVAMAGGRTLEEQAAPSSRPAPPRL